MQDRFNAALEALNPPTRLGLAVSGGGDSIAMLHLAYAWAQNDPDRQIMVSTVDHDLRAGSAYEAGEVSQICAALGLKHTTLTWRRDNDIRNLQSEARRARRALLMNWAVQNGISALLMAHSCDDQAETVLLRLQRGTGVDGLAGIASQSMIGPIRLLRPLLGFTRQELRDWLAQNGHDWIDDPSNEEPRFARIAMRKALQTLGLDPKRLTLAASHAAAAREVLSRAAHDAAQEAVQEEWSTLLIDTVQLRGAATETRERIWAGAIQWLTRSTYKPRLEALRRFISALERGQMAQLNAVVGIPDGSQVRLARDYAVLQRADLDPCGRWAGYPTTRLESTTPPIIQPAGPAGLAADRSWRGVMPRRAALAEPMAFDVEGQALRFTNAPTGLDAGIWQVKPRLDFATSLLFVASH